MPIGEVESFALNNDAVSLDVSQGNRTPLDDMVVEGLS